MGSFWKNLQTLLASDDHGDINWKIAPTLHFMTLFTDPLLAKVTWSHGNRITLPQPSSPWCLELQRGRLTLFSKPIFNPYLNQGTAKYDTFHIFLSPKTRNGQFQISKNPPITVTVDPDYVYRLHGHLCLLKIISLILTIRNGYTPLLIALIIWILILHHDATHNSAKERRYDPPAKRLPWQSS